MSYRPAMTLNTGSTKVFGVIKIRGQMFRVETGGDWGGGSEAGAVADAINALKAMKLGALITFHETLLAQQERAGELRMERADESLCGPIVSQHANPPEVEGAHGAWLQLTAIAKEDRHMYEKGN